MSMHAPSSKPDWLHAWRQLAATTAGLEREDPRLQPVLDALQVCDEYFVKGDWPGFLSAAARVVAAMASTKA
jgi:hypothetical protein